MLRVVRVLKPGESKEIKNGDHHIVTVREDGSIEVRSGRKKRRSD